MRSTSHSLLFAAAALVLVAANAVLLVGSVDSGAASPDSAARPGQS